MACGRWPPRSRARAKKTSSRFGHLRACDVANVTSALQRCRATPCGAEQTGEEPGFRASPHRVARRASSLSGFMAERPGSGSAAARWHGWPCMASEAMRLRAWQEGERRQHGPATDGMSEQTTHVSCSGGPVTTSTAEGNGFSSFGSLVHRLGSAKVLDRHVRCHLASERSYR